MNKFITDYADYPVIHNIQPIFYAFQFNSSNYSPEVSNIQRREAELNIILPMVNNFNIKQKMTWNVSCIRYPQRQTKPRCPKRGEWKQDS